MKSLAKKFYCIALLIAILYMSLSESQQSVCYYFSFDRPHGEWTLISSTVFEEELHETREDGVVETYSQLDIFVKMERKSSYYVTSVLLPIVLTSFLSLFVFLLPVESGEKVYICNRCKCKRTAILAFRHNLKMIFPVHIDI